MMRRLSFVTAMVAVVVMMLAFANPAVGQPVTGLDASYMSGEGEVPGPGDLNGSGTAHVTLIPSEGRICYSLEASDIAPATAAHIHQGAFHEAGPIVVGLDPPPTAGTSNGCTGVDPALLGSLMESPENYYVNVHNEEFPDGAIRGQLSKTEESSFSYG
jgi:CHRD domain